ncbi:MAG: hypothetical protein Q7J48_05425 [Nocardioides sp.]|nr:hypothetical protein [Nocardioides sp.]
MSTLSRTARAGDRLPGMVAAAFVAHDVPDSTPAERAEVARYVDDTVGSMPDVMRAGVRVAGLAAFGVLSIWARGRFDRVDEGRRAELASRLGGLALPGVGEFGRLTRGLGLACLYERRHGAPAGGAA